MGDVPADYRIKVGIRNNRILRALQDRGVTSLPKWCEEHGLNYGGVNGLICLRESALKARGGWTKIALDLALFLGADPEDLFTERQAQGGLRSVEREVSEETIISITSVPEAQLIGESPEDGLLEKATAQRLLPRLLGDLGERERRVLLRRYGFANGESDSLDEVAEDEGVSRERIRQIERRAVKKMRRGVAGLEWRAAVRRETGRDVR